MRRALWWVALSLVGALCWIVPASATTVIKFDSASGSDGVYNGFWAGLYVGTVQVGNKTTQANFVCDDYLSEIYVGDSWTANTSPSQDVTSTVRYLGGLKGQFGTGGLTSLYMSDLDLAPGSCALQNLYGTINGKQVPCVPNGGLGQQQEYNMVSYLVSSIFNDKKNGQYNWDGNWASMAGAIWSITDHAWGGTCTDKGYKSNTFNCDYLEDNGGSESAEYYVAQALIYYSTTNSSYTVYTPTSKLPACYEQNQPGYCNGQEFFGPAAEPTLPVLLSVTFLGVGLLGKRVFGESWV